MSRAARALKPEIYREPQAPEPQAATVTSDTPTGHAGAFWPARTIQAHLEEALSGEVQPKWSARKLLAFLLVTCGGFWLLVALLVRAAL